MRLKAFFLLFFILIFGFSAQAIQATCNSYVFFKKNQKDSSKLEANIMLSWRAQNKSIHFVKNSEGYYTANLMCIVRISNDTSILKEEEFVIKTPPKKDFQELNNLFIADLYEYPISSIGNFEIEFVLFEPDYKKDLFEYKNTHNISLGQGNNHLLSDIILLDTFFKSEQKTIFTKNGLVAIPSCSNFINEHKDSASWIYEFYPKAINPDSKTPGSITLHSFVSFKKNDSPIPGKSTIDTLNQNNQIIIPFKKSFEVGDLKSGNYYFNVICKKNEEEIGNKTIFFQLYNPDYKPKAVEKPTVPDSTNDSNTSDKNSHILDLTNTFVGKFNAAQIRLILKMLLLICDPLEAASINGFLQKPDELYSKYFIYNFWEKRDKLNPGKAWQAYAEKIREVNRLFKGSGMNGFETDRGRVYIQYGKPNDRIIVNNESGSLPYEIWQYYNTEKQGMEGVFLFYRPGRALGDYQLLHSTLRGERRNGNWRSLLYSNSITGGGISNANSQAEQYIGNK